jgi:nucleotide-binding universal stress UspA family protein
MSEEPRNGEPVIVVGVDGSETSKDALRWAAREARREGARLRVVLCWRVPNQFYGGGVPAPIERDLKGESQAAVEEIAKEVLGDDGPSEVSTEAIEGHAAAELVKAAETAELLVVGSRGRGAFAGMLLGSISRYCVSHAACPVVVVRHHDD